MKILWGLDESYKNVLFTLTERILAKKVIVNNAKTILLTHESRVEGRKTHSISPLLIVNLTVKNGFKPNTT